MARFGQGINPQLSAVDYSPIMQGTQIAAQGIAQGGQNIGNALAQLGQIAGGAVQKYYENKDKKEFIGKASDRASEFLTKYPELKDRFMVRDPNDKGAIKAIFKEFGGGDEMKGAAFVTQSISSFINEQEQMKAAKEAETFRNAPLAPGAPYATPTAAVMEYLRRGGKADVANAVMGAQPKPEAMQGTVISEQDLIDARARGIDITATPLGGGRYLATRAGSVAAPTKFVRSPAEEAEAAALSTEAKAKAESAVKMVDETLAAGRTATDTMAKQMELRRLLESSSTQTGAGQEWLTLSRAYAKRFLGAPDKDLQDQQAVETLIAEDQFMVTKDLLKGQGSVSNFERQSINEAGLKASKDKGALLNLLSWREAATQRALAAAEVAATMDANGAKAVEIKREIDRFYRENPLSAFRPAGFDELPKPDFGSANSIIRPKKP